MLLLHVQVPARRSLVQQQQGNIKSQGPHLHHALHRCLAHWAR